MALWPSVSLSVTPASLEGSWAVVLLAGLCLSHAFPLLGSRPVPRSPEPAPLPRLSWETEASPLLPAALIRTWSAAAPPSGLRAPCPVYASLYPQTRLTGD